jgi:hypothetical protein
MSNQDLVAQVEQLRAQQVETDASLVTLTDWVEKLVGEVKANPMSGVLVGSTFAGASHELSAIKQGHQRKG